MEQHSEDMKVSGSRYQSGSLVVAVEGNIGAGKSTFLKYCEARPSVAVYPEPIEKWRNVNGENLLANYYADAEKWAVTFQLYAGMTVLENYTRKTWKRLKIVERSLLSARYVFWEHMKRTGEVEPAMGHVLDTWYANTLENHRAKPHVIVYLRTTPSVAYDRVLERARGEEAAVSQAYLEEIHSLYEDWVSWLQDANNLSDDPSMVVIVINADAPVEQLYSQYEACLEHLNVLTL